MTLTGGYTTINTYQVKQKKIGDAAQQYEVAPTVDIMRRDRIWLCVAAHIGLLCTRTRRLAVASQSRETAPAVVSVSG